MSEKEPVTEIPEALPKKKDLTIKETPQLNGIYSETISGQKPKEELKPLTEAEMVLRDESLRNLQEKYGFTAYELEVIAETDAKLAPNLARLIRYKANKIEDPTVQQDFLESWQNALSTKWRRARINPIGEKQALTGNLQISQLFNAYQPRSSRYIEAKRPPSLADLRPEDQTTPETRKFIASVQDIVRFLYLEDGSNQTQKLTSQERRELFRDRLEKWRSSGKPLAEFIHEYSQNSPNVSYPDLAIYKKPEDRTVIEDVVLSTYIPALARNTLNYGRPGSAPETIALQKNTSDMIKNEFPELSLLLVESHREKLIQLGTGSATHSIAPMFPEELKFQYESALVNHLLSLGIQPAHKGKEGSKRTIVPLHIPECATTAKLWQVLSEIQDKYNIEFVTGIDSLHHLNPEGNADAAGLNSIAGVRFGVRNNAYSMEFAFPPDLNLTDYDPRDVAGTESKIKKYFVMGMNAVLINGFGEHAPELAHLVKGENALILRQTDFEEVGHHHRVTPLTAYQLENLYRKFGIQYVALGEYMATAEAKPLEIGNDVNAEASWNGHGDKAFSTWINQNTEWLWGEVGGMLKLTHGVISQDIKKCFGPETNFEDLPLLMYQELKGHSPEEINSMSSYEMLRAAALSHAHRNGVELAENQIRNLFVKLSYYEDLLSSCPYWWSPAEKERVMPYLEETPTVMQAREAALKLAEYSIRLVTDVSDFKKFADYFFAEERLKVTIQPPKEEVDLKDGAEIASQPDASNKEEVLKLSTSMRDQAARRIYEWLNQRKNLDNNSLAQFEYWTRKMTESRIAITF